MVIMSLGNRAFCHCLPAWKCGQSRRRSLDPFYNSIARRNGGGGKKKIRKSDGISQASVRNFKIMWRGGGETLARTDGNHALSKIIKNTHFANIREKCSQPNLLPYQRADIADYIARHIRELRRRGMASRKVITRPKETSFFAGNSPSDGRRVKPALEKSGRRRKLGRNRAVGDAWFCSSRPPSTYVRA